MTKKNPARGELGRGKKKIGLVVRESYEFKLSYYVPTNGLGRRNLLAIELGSGCVRDPNHSVPTNKCAAK